MLIIKTKSYYLSGLHYTLDTRLHILHTLDPLRIPGSYPNFAGEEMEGMFLRTVLLTF